jgi:hypothetical protein
MTKDGDNLTEAILGLKSAIQLNQIYPSRAEVRRLAKIGHWVKLGEIYGFTPVFILIHGKPRGIDWNCLPEPLASALLPLPRFGRLAVRVIQRQVTASPKRHRVVLYIEQEKLCYYCQKPTDLEDWTIDHKIPLSRGGSNARHNKVGCCRPCNAEKGAMTADEYVPIRNDKPQLKAMARSIQDALREMPTSVQCG